MHAICLRLSLAIGLFALVLWLRPVRGEPTAEPEWTSSNTFRILLTIDPRGRTRSGSPASVELDFQSLLGGGGTFDEHTVEVVAYDAAGRPKTFDSSRQGAERQLVPRRLDRLFGSTRQTLNFVMSDHTCTRLAVYFDTVESQRGQPQRQPGIVGDGDRFYQSRQPREITASHFDQFVDFDADGDLDLFKGGVEPFVYCYENVGGNRMLPRGRLASGGRLFTLPRSKANRSWVTVALHDLDGDGDQDFFPSFGDGPNTGQFVFFRNTTIGDGLLAFSQVGPLRTASGMPLAGGAQQGGWFPSIAFIKDWDGLARGRLDALVGSNHRCWLYRGQGTHSDGSPRFDEAVPVQAGGADINLVNPRFHVADIDSDGDLDLFAGTQPGPIWWFENAGTRDQPELAAGRVVAFDGTYLIGDAHSGVQIHDFDGDGQLDLLAGRFWERTNLNRPQDPRDFGGFYRNLGSRAAPRFARGARGAPFTEQFQICDAARQNCVHAVDWDVDGKLDLLAGDTDGFLWYFRNEASRLFPLFAAAEKVQAGGQPLCVASSGGHARFDVCDWNSDGKPDLLVADGQGSVTLFLNSGGESKPAFLAGQGVVAGGKPIQGATRASVRMCDWDHDGRHDVLLADEKGYYWRRNIGSGASPLLAEAKAVIFHDRPARYIRPNLGSHVDWDGDGRLDFIGCEFENSIRWYRNIGPGARGAEPQFADAEGLTLVQASSPQMISGAHAIDWNGDGDLDILTGQGHGGSGLRFYERDWIEDELRNSHPRVSVGGLEKVPAPLRPSP